MGVIKGSASSGKSLAPLSRQEYLDRSCRLAPVFVLEDDRSLVYDIFQKYEDIKKQNQDVDNVDRVVRIMSAIRRDTSLKQLLESTFDEIYIDEVQDQRCVDIQLLLEFIKDSRGLHFAGDTAQAISQDSTFRFSDVKAIIYEHFAPASIYANQSQLAHTTMFTLSKNYRSHQGILALASLIMGMMWKGFPETVDKLEPEIGNLNGPKPILFLRCDANILRTSNVGLVNLSDRTADFGAEQVILVRDEAMKARLQGEIGDIALILTILDSKGMEFDDVILWDFFASTSDPSGVRSLRALTADAQSAFDGQGHSGMCSELKNLYVAITRARIQFIMIESSEKAMVTIVDLLTSGPSGSLVDVTRPHDAGFAEKLKMLRPGTSIDPVRYSLRGEEFMQRGNYEEAIWCFHRAKDERGETIANGKLFEAKGRECQAQNDVQGFIQNLEAAIRFFLQTDKIGDAAKNYERLTKFRDAAELWLKHNESAKAAPFFAKAGLYVQASECYDRIGNYSGAAAVLREGEQYDEMVCYLCNNRENIPYESFQSFNLLCKMLLKKNKISFNYRNYAIKILGSLAEQEKCFSEYGMNDELADLYASHMRHKDLFHLLSKNEKLEEALSLAITKDLLHSTADGLEPEVLSLLDYVWAGHLSKSPQQHSTAPLNLPSGFLTPSVRLRAEQWKVSSLVYNLEGSLARQQFANMESSVPKTILCLQKVLGATTIAQQTIIDDFPFEMIQHAVSFAKDLTLDKASDTVRTALLLNGVWKPESGKENLIVLPWSPLREMLTNISKIDASKVVIQQILDRLASGMLAFDTKARDLWKKKWPERCVHFMTLQYCPRKRNGEECHWLHQLMDTDDCSRKLNDLLQVNSVFCGLAPLHYRRCMNETFQERYFGIKRHWNERLLREFVHLSAVEQCTSVITKTGKELFYDRKYIAISSSLEELLFFRLVREWSERNNFTSLLEQMQLAQTFSPNVQNRIFRALSHRLHRDQRGLLQNHLSLLSSITQGLSCQDALAFQSNLNAFLRNLHNIDVQAFSTLHALTAVFEYLAAYLILKTCVSGCMLTQAWVDLDVPRFAHAVHSEERLEWFEWNHKYQQCLMELTKAFCGILRRLNEVPQPGITLLCKGNTHHALLLRQRNVELVAIVVANLAPTTPVGFGDLWTIAKEVFEYGFVRAYYMRSSTALEVAPKLVSSFSKYNGKNSLIVVIKDRKKGSHFSALERQPSVKTVAFDQICPVAKSPAATQASAQISPSTTLDSPQEEYTETEIEAASKIQDFWRCCSRKIKIRRSYMELPRARAIAHFISLGAESPATLTFVNKLAFRDTLISQGVAMSSRLADARETLFKLQEEAMTCAENVEISSGSFESVDDALHRNGEVETLLKKAEETMSPEYMRGVVRMGVLTVLKKAMKDIGKLVAEAEREMLQTRKMIDQVSRSCT